MKRGIFKLATQTIKYYRKPVLYQVLIIVLLTAVITGSLLTGSSVKNSLKRVSAEHLGKTGLVVSSGQRYLAHTLVTRLRDSLEINSAGILIINGFCQNISNQKEALKTQIIAVDNNYFKFQGNDTLKINLGEVLVNRRLAQYLGLKKGDDLALHYDEISDFPAGAPFAPEKGTSSSKVFKVGMILDDAMDGNFSLSISQVTPMNLFINLSEVENDPDRSTKINRILIDSRNNYTVSQFSKLLKKSLRFSDIGLRIRNIAKTNQYELISNRIFIDSALVNDIQELIPTSAPLLTYMGNKFTYGGNYTPYSFISALPSSQYPDISTGNRMIINKWMADDLRATKGDTITLTWYSPESPSKLSEVRKTFIIDRVVPITGVWSDSLLMPDFPGITAKESCSDWDAGIPIDMNLIRPKDEDYWYRYKGTPKAFINYEMGKELWGNNFGPATAIRFTQGIAAVSIEDRLDGALDLNRTGITVSDIKTESIKAADQSVDFGSLFLSLGFFLLLASVVLLSFAVSEYFDTRKVHIKTLFALGFRPRLLKRILFIETGIIALTGSVIGAFSGIFVNFLIIKALNSVWKGAVQTDTLRAWVDIVPILSGFAVSLIVMTVFMTIKILRYLKKLNRQEGDSHKTPSARINLLFLVPSLVLTIALYILSTIFRDKEIIFCFSSGMMLLASIVLFWRQLYLSGNIGTDKFIRKKNGISRIYYSHYPSHAVTPVLFIAAGIFAVFITGANRMNFSGKYLDRSSGTGGYLLWCETTIPVKNDLNTNAGRNAAGLDSKMFKDLVFVQGRVSSGNDASCLNLNHIVSPPILGIDPSDFIKNGSFSFASQLEGSEVSNPWSYLTMNADTNTIYGIADQTVLEWGLKHKTGDTLLLKAEDGNTLKVIIAAGLESSVFQGYLLIGMKNFTRYFPSVPGSTIMLVEGDPALTENYRNTLAENFNNSGIEVQATTDRLAAFYEVTNTYLSVFGVFGAFGMIIGIAGLGFVLMRNYNQRKRDFALMLATGHTFRKIRQMILSEQLRILVAGVSAGVISAMLATLPSLKGRTDVPWVFLSAMVVIVLLTGIIVLYTSVKSISGESLTSSLKKD